MKSGQRRRIEKVRLDALRVPPPGTAQRAFREAKANKMAAEFDIDSFGLLVVCRVEEVNWLVDGQHRVAAIQKAGHAKSTDSIECEVYEGLELADMARLFLGRNESTPVTAFERFGVAVTAGYSKETAIKEIVEKAGLKIGYPGPDGNIFSVGALRRVHDRYGAKTLERVLNVLRSAYNRSASGLGRQLIDGIGLVIASYARVDDKVLVEALSKELHGVHGVHRRAEDYRERLGRPVPECVAAGVVDIYNQHAGRKRSLVKLWKILEGGKLRRGTARRLD